MANTERTHRLAEPELQLAARGTAQLDGDLLGHAKQRLGIAFAAEIKQVAHAVSLSRRGARHGGAPVDAVRQEADPRRGGCGACGRHRHACAEDRRHSSGCDFTAKLFVVVHSHRSSGVVARERGGTASARAASARETIFSVTVRTVFHSSRACVASVTREAFMGDVIRASAAVEEIFKDARSALNSAVAKGGTVKDRAEQGLGPVVAMIDATESELKVARDVLAPLSAAASAENDRADALLNRIYDETWNDVDRPANDRYLTLMYPGGAGYYTDGDTPGQPAR